MRQLAWAIFQLFIGYMTILAMDGMVMPPWEQIAIIVGAAFFGSILLAAVIDTIGTISDLLRRKPIIRREPTLDF